MFAVFLGVRSAGQANDLPTSLVNVYRRIASLYLGASLPDLPDHAYGATFESPYVFVPVNNPLGPIERDLTTQRSTSLAAKSVEINALSLVLTPVRYSRR